VIIYVLLLIVLVIFSIMSYQTIFQTYKRVNVNQIRGVDVFNAAFFFTIIHMLIWASIQLQSNSPIFTQTDPSNLILLVGTFSSFFIMNGLLLGTLAGIRIFKKYAIDRERNIQYFPPGIIVLFILFSTIVTITLSSSYNINFFPLL